VRVLVIGGTRFIGAHAVRQFVAAGADVTVFHRGRSEATLPGASSISEIPARNIRSSDFRNRSAAATGTSWSTW
jgi:nucleoside-diphosphate-sugar epimerase